RLRRPPLPLFPYTTPFRSPLVTATADSKGNFRIEPPKEQQIVDLRVDAAGYAPEAIRLQSDDEIGAIILTRAESKSGTVKADGKDRKSTRLNSSHEWTSYA